MTDKRISAFVHEFLVFGLKQAYACLFGGILLFLVIVTKLWYPLESIHRYDFLFLMAIAVQVGLLALKLESIREFWVILLFHIVATGLEFFKTSDSIQSWTYPE